MYAREKESRAVTEEELDVRAKEVAGRAGCIKEITKNKYHFTITLERKYPLLLASWNAWNCAVYYKYYTSCILIEIEYSRLSVSTLFERVSTLHDGTVTSLRVTVPVCSVLTSSNSVLTRDVSIQSRSKYKRYSVYVTKRVLSFFLSVYWRPLV